MMKRCFSSIPINKAFTFQGVGSIVNEIGCTKRIADFIKGEQCRKLFIVTDAGIMKHNLMDNALQSLSNNNVEYLIWDETLADPKESLVLEAVEKAKSFGASGVLGFGGGSSMDIAKLVAYLAHSNCTQELTEIYGLNQITGSRMPLFQVPTTAGTGSEVTPLSILTTPTKEKKGVGSYKLYADWAILDAELTKSVPPLITAATGIDAMVHAIESYTSKLRKNPLSDMYALQALKLIGGNIYEVCQNGSNLEARSDMLLGSCLAGISFANSPVAAVHALAYPLANFNLSHGLTNSLMLPGVLEFNAVVCSDLYAEMAPSIMGENYQSGSADEVTHNLVKYLRQMNVDLLPGQSRLRDVGISESDLDALADGAMKQTRLLPNNPREVLWHDARRLYAEAY